ncbi:MAG: FAD-dependent oxidoreductase [Euryarchaeota archaeon]|nr:FAD-dependent oxidoreductase [Euryarchaeota archaeon]
MEKTNVLIIGGGPAGIVTAVTAKSNYPEKEILVVRKEEKVLIPCGIPYIFGTLDNSEKDVVPDAVLENAGVNLKIDEIVSINKENKVAKTEDGTEINFEKLVFATGSSPYNPKWLKGVDLNNVFLIKKDKKYLDDVKAKLKDCKKIIVIGGGFIGVEVSDELTKMGKDVTVVELLPHVLGLAFDGEFASIAEDVLRARGIRIKAGSGVKEILGNEKVSAVLLENGEKIGCDAVVLSMGYRPNSRLAEKAGIRIGNKKSIWVDEYMRTDHPDILAVGDCAEKKSFITRKVNNVMLASTATTEARIAGMTLYEFEILKTFNGTISIFSTAIGDAGFAATGITESQANEKGFKIITGSFEKVDKHPGSLPNAHKQKVKLIASKVSGILLGGQVAGGKSAGELINVVGLAIQNKMSVTSLLTAQIGTHPLLTAPPTAYPIIKCAEIISKKLEK